MPTKSTPKIIEQIEAYANTLMQALRVLDERRHILEPLLHDENVKAALRKKFENTYGAQAYNHLAPLLGQDLIRDMFRLFLDNDPRAGSLVNLYRKAKEPKVRKALKERFRNIPDKWHDKSGLIEGLSEEQSRGLVGEWRNKDKDDFEASFEDGWLKVEKAIKSIEQDSVANKIKTFRDKYHAHLEMTPLGKDPRPFDIGKLGLTYNDILDFLDIYMEATYELVRVVTGKVYDIESFSKVHRRCGIDMWRILAGIENRHCDKQNGKDLDL